MSTPSWVVSGAEKMPVPSGAVPIKVVDGRSFANANELGVKSLVGRGEELESFGPEHAHADQ